MSRPVLESCSHAQTVACGLFIDRRLPLPTNGWGNASACMHLRYNGLVTCLMLGVSRLLARIPEYTQCISTHGSQGSLAFSVVATNGVWQAIWSNGPHCIRQTIGMDLMPPTSWCSGLLSSPSRWFEPTGAPQRVPPDMRIRSTRHGRRRRRSAQSRTGR